MNASTKPLSLRLLSFPAGLVLFGLLSSAYSTAQQKSEMTLAEFRAAVREHASAGQQQPSNAKRGSKAAQPAAPEANTRQANDRAVREFTRLLSAQARKAAARQSQDRLAGWRKAAEARLQAQNETALDAEQLRLAEAQATAQVARFEAARLAAQREANSLLGRAPESPLVATMVHGSGGAAAAENPKAAGEPAPSGAPLEPAPGVSSRIAYYEKQLLPAGNELLTKMYQSYLFGGVALSSLLWQEQELTRFETEYRLLNVQAEVEMDRAGGGAGE